MQLDSTPTPQRNLSPVRDLIAALREDSDYYRTWRDNISMCFQDSCHWSDIKFPQLKEVSDKAAEEFLTRLMYIGKDDGR